MANRASSAMGGSKKKSKKSKKGHKHVREMHIRHAANGGYIVRHSPQAGQMTEEPEEHALPDMSALTQHVEDHMQPQAAQAAPSPTPQGPAPQMPA